MLDAFKTFKYPNEIGPGVYDIHSPVIPIVEQIIYLIKSVQQFIDKNKLWVNPDCGLKTRGWYEVEQALINMVSAAKVLRAESFSKSVHAELLN